tara:strand:- start:1308 stop:2261 length:954 start_codon:yes stop_codon:yes gene_type:complete
MANDYTNTSDHYLPVPAITDKFSYTRDIQNLRILLNKGMESLAARDSSADNYLLAAGNAGVILSSSDAFPRGRVAPLVANADATLLFQENDGAALNDKWVMGWDDSGVAFVIHDAATIPATVQDARFAMLAAQTRWSHGDSGASAHAAADDYVFEGTATVGLSLLASAGKASQIFLGNADNNDSVRLTWNAANTRAEFGTSVTGGQTRLLSDTGVLAMTISSGQEIGIGTTNFGAMLRIDQSSGTGAKPVLYLDQADSSEEFIFFRGRAANADLTTTIVEESAVTTATRRGFLRMEVQDDGNQITDQAYYMAIYTLA